MKFPKTLDAKPVITDDNDNEIIDMTFSTLKDAEFSYVDMFMCTKNEEMRADLIAQLAFGNIERLEELLKGNDVSNPFAIEEGNVFLVPDLMSTKTHFTSLGVLSDIRAKIRKQYIDSSKAPDTTGMNDALASYKEREKTALPPNISKEGDREMIIKDGVIVFGPDVTRKKTKTEELLATQNYLEKLRKNNKNIYKGTKTYK